MIPFFRTEKGSFIAEEKEDWDMHLSASALRESPSRAEKGGFNLMLVNELWLKN